MKRLISDYDSQTGIIKKIVREGRKYGYGTKDICDEVWYIPYNVVLGMQLQLKNEQGSYMGS